MSLPDIFREAGGVSVRCVLFVTNFPHILFFFCEKGVSHGDILDQGLLLQIGGNRALQKANKRANSSLEKFSHWKCGLVQIVRK